MKRENESGFEKLFSDLPLNVSPDEESQQALRQAVLAAHEETASQPNKINAKKSNIGSLLMKYRIPQWASVAAALGFISFALQFTSPAFAIEEAIKRIVSAKTATFDMLIEAENLDIKMKVYLSGKRIREEGDSQITIRDASTNQVLILQPQIKQAILTSIDTEDLTQGAAPQSLAPNMFEDLRTLLENNKEKAKPLGRKVFDGKALIGFSIPTSDREIQLWSDEATNSAKRIEYSLPSQDLNIVLLNYKTDVPIDSKLLSFDIPAGYQLNKTQVDASTMPGEKDLINTLRLCVELNDEFPSSVGTMALPKLMSAYTRSLLSAGLDPTDVQGLQQAAIDFSRGFTFSDLLLKENDAHYAGEGATPGDTERAIFWYRPTLTSPTEVSDSYRVIYADLSVREQATAPNIEDAKRVGVLLNN